MLYLRLITLERRQVERVGPQRLVRVTRMCEEEKVEQVYQDVFAQDNVLDVLHISLLSEDEKQSKMVQEKTYLIMMEKL